MGNDVYMRKREPLNVKLSFYLFHHMNLRLNSNVYEVVRQNSPALASQLNHQLRLHVFDQLEQMRYL